MCLTMQMAHPATLAARSKVNDRHHHLSYVTQVASPDTFPKEIKSVLERFLKNRPRLFGGWWSLLGYMSLL